MTRLMTIATVLAAGLGFASVGGAQGRQGQQQSEKVTLPIVEVVGCLNSVPNNGWALTEATEPATSNSASTTADAVKAAQAKPLGTQRYVLIGVNQFNPTSHKGHKMAVKGILIKDAKETRINVTSFQMAGATCAK